MPGNTRYTAVAITLHWAIAAAIIANLVLGLWMSRAIESSAGRSTAIDAFQIHKSIGLTVLVLSLLRVAWRCLYPPPPLPGHMKPGERAVAQVTHWLFYGLMVGIPLSGWFYVSTQWRGDAPFTIPTLWFGLFEVPHLLGLHQADPALRDRLASLAISSHTMLALALTLLLVVHVAAALRHQFWQRDGILARMLPWLSPRESTAAPPGPRRSGALAGAALLTIATALIGYGATTSLAPPNAAGKPEADKILQELLDGADNRARSWPVDKDNSHIRFAGVHAGNPFQGHFGHWQAAIRFDPQHPGRSRIAALVETGSATDGVPLHDRTLPQGEWFDAADHPYATYRSTEITRTGDASYQLKGTLTIKDNPVALAPFTLVVDGDKLHIRGRAELDRADVDMGMESDPGGQWVSRMITVNVDVVARRPAAP